MGKVYRCRTEFFVKVLKGCEEKSGISKKCFALSRTAEFVVGNKAEKVREKLKKKILDNCGKVWYH